MIKIKNGEHIIYDPRNPYLKLADPKLMLEDNAAGHLTFKIYNANLNYYTIKKLYPILEVIRDEETIFKGRVISDKKDFYNGKSVEAEGKLAFFNDSYMEPFEFSGSPAELFSMIIENHNSQVKEWQRFCVGKVTVKDPNDYIVRSSESIISSWEALKSRCFQSSLGGHVRVRYEADGDYIDWLEDYVHISGQGIAFAKNMTDLTSETDATETYTAIRPVGAEVDGEKIDISSVNEGKKYIINEEMAALYGIIFAPESESVWEDVTLPTNLLKKARERLSGQFITMKETYEIRAVDLNLTDKNIEALNICEYVPVSSGPHGIQGNYLLYKADIAIAQPQNSVFYLGASRRILSDMSSGGIKETVKIPGNISFFQNDAGYISEKETEALLRSYTKAEDVEAMLGEAVSKIPAGEDGKSAYEIAVDGGFSGTEEEWIASLKSSDGYSPIIRENENNSATIYKLDIITKDKTFTTPNLRGEDGNKGEEAPFNLGIDAEGNYGYYRKDTGDFVPFGAGGSESAFEVARWYALSNDGFVYDGQSTWSIEFNRTSQDKYSTLSIAVNVPNRMNCPYSFVFGVRGIGKIYLNGNQLVSKNSDTSTGSAGTGILGLSAGTNNVTFLVKPFSSSYAVTSSITLSPLGV